jgi:diacylglycerol kinase family enzyme
MRMPLSLSAAASTIVSYKPQTISVGMLKMGDAPGRCFLCMAGCGLDAEIVSRLNLSLKASCGKLAYYVTGFSQVFRPLREFPVIVDGVAYEASFALISRVRNYGGDLEIARGASLLKPDFEVVLFRGTVAIRYLRYLLGVAVGKISDMPGCTVLRGTRVECPSDGRIFVQMDGELAGQLPATADIAPDALTLLAPERFVASERAMLQEVVCA